MSTIGPLFKSGDYLHAGDSLVSANGLFCAYLFEDGNLCIYGSPTPDANTFMWASGPQVALGPKSMYLHNDGNLCIYNSPTPDANTNFWCSGSQTTPGPKCAYLHDDGNLCIYNSEFPDAKTFMWASGPSDPVVNMEILSIDYDVAAAKILNTGAQGITSLPVTNDTPQTQTSKVSLSGTITETSGWSDTLGGKIGVKVTGEVGIPLLAEGKVEVSAEVSYAHTWSGSETRSKSWAGEISLTVPPFQAYVVMGVVSVSTIAVPYTMNVTTILSSGRRIPGQTVKGIYTGTNSHDFTVKYVVQDSSSGELATTEAAFA